MVWGTLGCFFRVWDFFFLRGVGFSCGIWGGLLEGLGYFGGGAQGVLGPSPGHVWILGEGTWGFTLLPLEQLPVSPSVPILVAFQPRDVTLVPLVTSPGRAVVQTNPTKLLFRGGDACVCAGTLCPSAAPRMRRVCLFHSGANPAQECAVLGAREGVFFEGGRSFRFSQNLGPCPVLSAASCSAGTRGHRGFAAVSVPTTRRLAVAAPRVLAAPWRESQNRWGWKRV